LLKRSAMAAVNRRSFLMAAGGLVVPATARAVDDGTNPDYYNPEPEVTETVGGYLPGHRVVSYYGFPDNPYMGILGEHDKDTLLGLLQEQAAEYEALDPSRPVVMAFELMATVAQADAGDDGMFITYTDPAIIQDYVDYTAEHGLFCLLDVQFGRQSIQDQVGYVEEWLAYDHVHLALDGEFKVVPPEQPGQDLGNLYAPDITWCQHEMVRIAQEAGISPKMLLVHQFNWYTIPDKEDVGIVPGVQLVMECDGFGTPEEKLETYAVIITNSQIEYNGFKLFYQQDNPLMTPDQVLALNPVPEIVIYQ
jgi:hypothetical protein